MGLNTRTGAQSTAADLGAHVSTAGGVANAPARAAEIGATVAQIFTKQPSRWAEPEIDDETAASFDAARDANRIRLIGSHDSYLINLASPDPQLRQRSLDCFIGELRRCERLGLDFLVTHPGNATDGDVEHGLDRNASALEAALAAVPGRTRVLLETTAGSGTALGASFEQLAAIIRAVSPEYRERIGVCFDTCHVWVAGYDLAGDYNGVMRQLEQVVGLDRVGAFHLNDSIGDRGSRRDRHANIGEGTLGLEAFRALINDERFFGIPKLLETPKEDDADRRNLATLRGLIA